MPPSCSVVESGGSSLAPDGLSQIKLHPHITKPRKQNPPPPPAAPGRIFVTPAMTRATPSTKTTIAAIRFIGRPPLWGRRPRALLAPERDSLARLASLKYADLPCKVSSAAEFASLHLPLAATSN